MIYMFKVYPIIDKYISVIQFHIVIVLYALSDKNDDPPDRNHISRQSSLSAFPSIVLQSLVRIQTSPSLSSFNNTFVP